MLSSPLICLKSKHRQQSRNGSSQADPAMLSQENYFSVSARAASSRSQQDNFPKK
jgi:hypothetical protein